MRTETIDAIRKVCEDLIQVAGMVREDGTNVVNTRDHIAIIKHYNILRLAREQIKETQEAIVEMSDKLSREDVPEVMAEHNVRTITVEGVGRVSITHRYSCSMLDKQMGFEWLRANGNEGLITETVNSSTLAAFAKDLLVNDGFELPPDIFKTSIMAYTSITKAGVI